MNASSSILLGFAGESALPENSRAAASCYNVGKWMDDAVLGLDIVVGQNPRLPRVAAMIANGGVTAELALYVEQSYWDGSDPYEAERLEAADVDAAAVDRYNELVSQDRSDVVGNDFVVYAVSYTTTIVSIYYLDLAVLPDNRTRRGMGNLDVTVVGSDSVEALVVPRQQCE